jgi:putative tricarboxylic transport membrane protein
LKKRNSTGSSAGTAKIPEPEPPFPEGRIRNDHIAGLALFLVALGIAWETYKLPLGSLHDPGPGYMPLLLAIALGGFGLIVTLRGASSPLFRSRRWPEAAHALKILLACVFAAFTLERLGYRLTVVILLIFLLGVIERRRPILVAAVALGFSFGTFFLFSNLLKVPLPRGPWGF